MTRVSVPVSLRRPRRPGFTAVATAYAVLLSLVGLAAVVRFQPAQVPGYLLLVGFDFLQNPLAPGLGGLAFDAAFRLYLLALSALGAAVVGRS